MRITLHQLRLLLAVAREGGISRAAQRLHLAQPTLSAQLRQLADQVGLPLYEVIGRQLHLTPAGEALAGSAARLERELDELEELLAELRGDTGGRLRLAVVSTAETFIPRLLGDFRRARPAIQVSLAVLNRQAVVERLADNRDDLYIMSKPPADQALAQHRFLRNPLVVIAPADHRLARRPRVQAAELAAEEFVLREAGSGTRQAAEAFFAAQGLALQPRLELGSNEAVKQAVAGGLGISVLSAHALGAQTDELAVLAVDNTPIPTFWQVVYPAGKRLTPLAQSFLGFLEGRAAQIEQAAEARLQLARAWARAS